MVAVQITAQEGIRQLQVAFRGRNRLAFKITAFLAYCPPPPLVQPQPSADIFSAFDELLLLKRGELGRPELGRLLRVHAATAEGQCALSPHCRRVLLPG